MTQAQILHIPESRSEKIINYNKGPYSVTDKEIFKQLIQNYSVIS